MEEFIVEQTEKSITWDYNIIDGISESSCNSHLHPTFTGEEIETMIKIDEAINAMHNHELYIHGVAQDYAPLIFGIVNTIAIIYLIYKLNTNKNG